jgi:hypothetical protein
LYCFYFGVALALKLQTPFTGFGNSMHDSESVRHTGRSESSNMDVGYQTSTDVRYTAAFGGEATAGGLGAQISL